MCFANLKGFISVCFNDAVFPSSHQKKSGGCTIVENTSIGISRDLATLKHISQSTGVNIVCGTGM